MARTTASKPAEAVTPAAGLRRTKVPPGEVGKSARVFSAAIVSEMLAVSRNTVTRWIRDGMPHEGDEKAYQLGDSVFYAAAGYAVQRVVYVPDGGLPARTLPGARDPATGFPYWLPVTEPSRAFDITVDNSGKLSAGQAILNRLTGVPYKLLANLAGSTFNMPFAASSTDMTFKVTKLSPAGAGTSVGTILFKAGSTVGTATTVETTFAAGDVLLVNAPDTASAQTTGAQFVIVGIGA